MIAVVEDEKELCESLKLLLTDKGYEIVTAGSCGEADKFIGNPQIDMFLLDVKLPDGSGFDICRKIRKSSEVPVIFLTSCDNEEEIVTGLDIGADDYVVKPFSPSEVMARLRAVLRRINRDEVSADSDSVLRINNMEVNLDEYSFMIDGKKIPLTKKEVETMWTLAGNPNKVFTRDNLLDSLWGYDYYGDSRTVDSHIKRLRAKIDSVEHPAWSIKTIWGVGYKFAINEEDM